MLSCDIAGSWATHCNEIHGANPKQTQSKQMEAIDIKALPPPLQVNLPGIEDTVIKQAVPPGGD